VVGRRPVSRARRTGSMPVPCQQVVELDDRAASRRRTGSTTGRISIPPTAGCWFGHHFAPLQAPAAPGASPSAQFGFPPRISLLVGASGRCGPGTVIVSRRWGTGRSLPQIARDGSGSVTVGQRPSLCFRRRGGRWPGSAFGRQCALPQSLGRLHAVMTVPDRVFHGLLSPALAAGRVAKCRRSRPLL